MHSTTCPGARTSSKQPAPSCRRIFRQKPPYATICPHLPPSGAETGLHRRSPAHVNSHRNELAIPANPTTWAVLLPWMGAAVFFLGDLADVARLVAFFAGVALWADLALDGATLDLCAATRGFLGAFGCSATGAALLSNQAATKLSR
jgi:hypothetical protein